MPAVGSFRLPYAVNNQNCICLCSFVLFSQLLLQFSSWFLPKLPDSPNCILSHRSEIYEQLQNSPLNENLLLICRNIVHIRGTRRKLYPLFVFKVFVVPVPDFELFKTKFLTILLQVIFSQFTFVHCSFHNSIVL